MTCPYCGTVLRPHKGWARMFYDGYCSKCDQLIEEGVEEDDERPEMVAQNDPEA